jgi:hypothetical protein
MLQLVEHATAAAAREKAVPAGAAVDVVHVANLLSLTRKEAAPEQVEEAAGQRCQSARAQHSEESAAAVADALFQQGVWHAGSAVVVL